MTLTISFRLFAPSEALRRIPTSTLKNRVVVDKWVSKAQRKAEPGFTATGEVMLSTHAAYPPPPESWFKQGLNHRQVGIYTWEREIEVAEYFISFRDLDDFILFLIEFEARLDTTVDPPTITIARNWRTDTTGYDDEDYDNRDYDDRE